MICSSNFDSEELHEVEVEELDSPSDVDEVLASSAKLIHGGTYGSRMAIFCGLTYRIKIMPSLAHTASYIGSVCMHT